MDNDKPCTPKTMGILIAIKAHIAATSTIDIIEPPQALYGAMLTVRLQPPYSKPLLITGIYIPHCTDHTGDRPAPTR